MKKFDFEHDDFKKQCLEKQILIKSNYDKPVTEEQFVEAINTMPKHEHWSWGHSPSSARYQYRRLVKNFGFFPGGQDAS